MSLNLELQQLVLHERLGCCLCRPLQADLCVCTAITVKLVISWECTHHADIRQIWQCRMLTAPTNAVCDVR